MKTLPQQLWGSFFGCTSVATPATLGYPSNSGVVGKHLSLGLSISHLGSLSHSHTHTLTHNHSTSLSFTLIHTNKNDRGKLPFLKTSRLPLMNESTTSGCEFWKKYKHDECIHTNKNDRGKLPFLQTSRLPLMNESTTSGCEFWKKYKHDECVLMKKLPLFAEIQARRVCVNEKTTSFCRDPGSH